MSNNHIKNFTVKNFKKFDFLEVKDIGQINLIVGDNNVGKTCLLESLLINERFKTTISYFGKLLEKRNLKNDLFVSYNELNKDQNFENNEIAFYQKDTKLPIEFVLNEKQIKIENKIARIKNEPDPVIQKFIKDVDLFQYTKINSNSQNWIYFSVDDQIKFLADITSEYYQSFLNDQTVIPALMLSDKIEDYIIETHDLIYLSLSSGELAIDVINSLFPNINITDLRLSSGLENNSSPILKREVFIKTDQRKEYHNIREYGDGFIRCLHIIYLIISNQSNRIIIDEIDTGIHYSKMKEFWINVFKICKDFDVQLFCSTHSKDCIDALIEAGSSVSESNDIKLIKLLETKDKETKAITYPFSEFEYLVESNSEVR